MSPTEINDHFVDATIQQLKQTPRQPIIFSNETARAIFEEMKDLRWIRNQVNTRVIPGDYDTTDAIVKLFTELRDRNASLEKAFEDMSKP